MFVLVQLSEPRNSDRADTQHSDFNGQGSVDFHDNHTEVASNQKYGTEDSTQHSSHNNDGAGDETLHDNDPYYVAAEPSDWTELEVKKLGRRKPAEDSSTNEVLSYHIDLSAYYASSQTVSTSNLFTITIAVFILIW